MSKTIPNKIYLTEDELRNNITTSLQTCRPTETVSASDDDAVCRAAGLGAAVPNGADRAGSDAERYIDIPKEVREIYATFRPSPLVRAYRLEKALGTPAKIYYKYEGVTPSGSHKLNTAIAQAFYNKAEGSKGSRPKRAPDNGEPRFPSPVQCSILNVPYIWCVSLTTRNLTERRSCRRTVRIFSPARRIKRTWGVRFWKRIRIRWAVLGSRYPKRWKMRRCVKTRTMPWAACSIM